MLTPDYFLAGCAIFTAIGKQKNYTFKIKRLKDDQRYGPTWSASVLTGPQNTSDYTYIGLVKKDGAVKLTPKSTYNDDAMPVKALRYVLKKSWLGEEMPEGCDVLPSSHCSRCGRTLTDETSIKTGIGPICAGLRWDQDERYAEPVHADPIDKPDPYQANAGAIANRLFGPTVNPLAIVSDPKKSAWEDF